ncbi:MAG: urease accessory protein UreF [Alphaproteobacteria bacterium]|nr:MAG: urease accessory protein UreF [Alphaproteobacteria bacterium]
MAMTIITTTEAEARAGADLYRLMTWLSPSYPVGAYTYSHGLEAAVEAGLVCDRATTATWVEGVLRHGGARADAILLAHAYDAAMRADGPALRGVAELANALSPTAEIALETTAQGAAFIEVTKKAWPCAALDLLAAVWHDKPAYPVAIGVAAAGHGIAREGAIHAYLHAFTANLVSAAVRIIPLGQTDGQLMTASLAPAVDTVALEAGTTKLEDMGTATLMVDICSMNHETQYTRLFRS